MARMLGRKVWDRVYCSCCNGGCVYGGSERCNFTCHDLTPREEDVFERLDRRDAAAWAWKRPRSLRRAGAFLAV